MVRKAEIRDIPGILKLLIEVDMVHHNARPDLFQGPATKYNASEIGEILQDPKRPIFVYEGEAGSVLGHAFCMEKQVVGDPVLTDIRTLYVDDICVEETARGKGVGRALYLFVKEYALKNDFYNITLNVWEGNPGAIAFYRAMGLKPQKIGMEEILGRESDEKREDQKNCVSRDDHENCENITCSSAHSSLRLRPYKPEDSKVIATWIRDERVFTEWGGERFGAFLISADVIDEKYQKHNGDCVEADNFYPMVAFDESGAVGHFILRYTEGDHDVIRVGWVILDPAKRGCGLGKQMVQLAVRYATWFLGAKKVTIGVFDHNEAACGCYRSVGFREIPQKEYDTTVYQGEEWKVLEMELIP